MFLVIGISGSLRARSFNTGLLEYAALTMPEDFKLERVSLRDVPLYDGDLERDQGIPAPVEDIKARLRDADGLWLASPEYNHGVSGVLKNALDWLSRPPRDIRRVFAGKPVGLSGATRGSGGTRLGQAACLPTLRALGTKPWFGGSLYVSKAHDCFDDDGVLTDPKVRERVEKFTLGFADFIRSQKRD